MFKFEKKQAEKALVITVGGFMKPDEAEAFLKEYEENVNSIQPSEYKLIIDSTDLAVSKQDMLPVLEGCFNLYMSNGFKKILMVNPSSVIAKNQMQKLAQSISYTGIFMDTMEEAYAYN